MCEGARGVRVPVRKAGPRGVGGTPQVQRQQAPLPAAAAPAVASAAVVAAAVDASAAAPAATTDWDVCVTQGKKFVAKPQLCGQFRLSLSQAAGPAAPKAYLLTTPQAPRARYVLHVP